MRVKSIVIKLEHAKSDLGERHANEMIFANGKWTADGPLFSRFLPMMHEVWKVVREATVHSESHKSGPQPPDPDEKS